MVFIPPDDRKNRTGGLSSMEQQFSDLAFIADSVAPENIASFTPQNLSGVEKEEGFAYWGSQNIDESQVIGVAGNWMEATDLMSNSAKAVSATVGYIQAKKKADSGDDNDELKKAGDEATDYVNEMKQERIRQIQEKQESGMLYLPPEQVTNLLEGAQPTEAEIYAIINNTTIGKATEILDANPDALTTESPAVDMPGPPEDFEVGQGVPFPQRTITNFFEGEAWDFALQSDRINAIFDKAGDKLKTDAGRELLESKRLQTEVLDAALRGGASNFRAYLINQINRLKNNPNITSAAADRVLKETIETFYKVNPDLAADGSLVGIVNNLQEQAVRGMEQDEATNIREFTRDLTSNQIPQMIVTEVMNAIESGDMPLEAAIKAELFSVDADGNVDPDNYNFPALLDLVTNIALGTSAPDIEGLPQEAIDRVASMLGEDKTGASSIAELRHGAVQEIMSDALTGHLTANRDLDSLSANLELQRRMQLTSQVGGGTDADWDDATSNRLGRYQTNGFANMQENIKQRQTAIASGEAAIVARGVTAWNRDTMSHLSDEDKFANIDLILNGSTISTLAELRAERKLIGKTKEDRDRILRREEESLRFELGSLMFTQIVDQETQAMGAKIARRLELEGAKASVWEALESGDGSPLYALGVVVEYGGIMEQITTLNNLNKRLGLPQDVPTTLKVPVSTDAGTMLEKDMRVTEFELVFPMIMDPDEKEAAAKQGIEGSLAFKLRGTYTDEATGQQIPIERYYPVDPDSNTMTIYLDSIRAIQEQVGTIATQTNAKGRGTVARNLASGRGSSGPAVGNLVGNVIDNTTTRNELRAAQDTGGLELDPDAHAESMQISSELEARQVELEQSLRLLYAELNTSPTQLSALDPLLDAYNMGNSTGIDPIMKVIGMLNNTRRDVLLNAAKDSTKYRKLGYFMEGYLNEFSTESGAADKLQAAITGEGTGDDLLALLETIGTDPTNSAGEFFQNADAYAIKQMQLRSNPDLTGAILTRLTNPEVARGENTDVSESISRRERMGDRRDEWNELYDPMANALSKAIMAQVPNAPEIDGWTDLHKYLDPSELMMVFEEATLMYVNDYLVSAERAETLETANIEAWAATQAQSLMSRYKLIPNGGQYDVIEDPNGYTDQSRLHSNLETEYENLSTGELLSAQWRSTPLVYRVNFENINPDHTGVGPTITSLLDQPDRIVSQTANSLYRGIRESMEEDGVIDPDSLTNPESFHSRQWYAHPSIRMFMEAFDELRLKEEGTTPEEVVVALRPHLMTLAMSNTGTLWSSQPDGENGYNLDAMTSEHLFIPGKLNANTGQWEVPPHEVAVAERDYSGITHKEAIDLYATITRSLDIPQELYQVLGNPNSTMNDVVMFAFNMSRGDISGQDVLEGMAGHFELDEAVIPITSASLGANFYGPNTKMSQRWLHSQGDIDDNTWKRLRLNGIPINDVFINHNFDNEASSKDEVFEHTKMLHEIRYDSQTGEPYLEPMGGYPIFTLNTDKIDRSLIVGGSKDPASYHKVPLDFTMIAIRQGDEGTFTDYTNAQQRRSVTLPAIVTQPTNAYEQKISKGFWSGEYTLDITASLQDPSQPIQAFRSGQKGYSGFQMIVSGEGQYRNRPYGMPQTIDGQTYRLRYDKKAGVPVLEQHIGPIGPRFGVPILSNIKRVMKRWTYGDKSTHTGYIFSPRPYRANNKGTWWDALPKSRYPQYSQYEFDTTNN
mgnify:CR=1 FL=1